jgi:hypothetical protein
VAPRRVLLEWFWRQVEAAVPGPDGLRFRVRVYGPGGGARPVGDAFCRLRDPTGELFGAQQAPRPQLPAAPAAKVTPEQRARAAETRAAVAEAELARVKASAAALRTRLRRAEPLVERWKDKADAFDALTATLDDLLGDDER